MSRSTVAKTSCLACVLTKRWGPGARRLDPMVIRRSHGRAPRMMEFLWIQRRDSRLRWSPLGRGRQPLAQRSSVKLQKPSAVRFLSGSTQSCAATRRSANLRPPTPGLVRLCSLRAPAALNAAATTMSAAQRSARDRWLQQPQARYSRTPSTVLLRHATFLQATAARAQPDTRWSATKSLPALRVLLAAVGVRLRLAMGSIPLEIQRRMRFGTRPSPPRSEWSRPSLVRAHWRLAQSSR